MGWREQMKSAAGSVGIVSPQRFQSVAPLVLQNGSVLDTYELVYETYGELNGEKSNALLICHALSGHHHAAGLHQEDDAKPGWWDACIGPGKAIDTDAFFVVSVNNLGGCHGGTGPRSVGPSTGKPYGPDFPNVVVKDWVNTQATADHLGIEVLPPSLAAAWAVCKRCSGLSTIPTACAPVSPSPRQLSYPRKTSRSMKLRDRPLPATRL